MRETLRRHAEWAAPRTEPGGATASRRGSRPAIRRQILTIDRAHSTPRNLCSPSQTPIDACRQSTPEPTRGDQAIHRSAMPLGAVVAQAIPLAEPKSRPRSGSAGPATLRHRPRHRCRRFRSGSRQALDIRVRPRTFDGDPMTIPLRFPPARFAQAPGLRRTATADPTGRDMTGQRALRAWAAGLVTTTARDRRWPAGRSNVWRPMIGVVSPHPAVRG